MTRSPPPAPKPKRFRSNASRNSSRSPTEAVAARRGLGLGGQPRQTAPRRPRPAPSRIGNVGSGSQRRRSFSADADDSGFIAFERDSAEPEDDSEDDDGNNGDDNSGGGAGVIDLTQSPVGNHEENAIVISSGDSDSSSVLEDEEPQQLQEIGARQAQQSLSPIGFLGRLIAEPHTPSNPAPNRTPKTSRRRRSSSPYLPEPEDIPEDDQPEDLYDATPQPRGFDPYYYPPVNSPEFSREADAQLLGEFQQSTQPELGRIHTPPRHGGGPRGGGHDHDLERSSAGSRPRRSGAPPPSSRGGRFWSAPPLTSTQRRASGQRHLGVARRSIGGLDDTPSRSFNNGDQAARGGQQRRLDRHHSPDTDDLPDYKSDTPSPKHPAVKKLDDCERDRAELNAALRQATLDSAAREAEISRLQGDVAELLRQNIALRGADDVDSPEIVRGEAPEDVFFDEPDDTSDVPGELGDALEECNRAKADLRRRKDECKDAFHRVRQEYNRLSDQFTEQLARYGILEDEALTAEERSQEFQRRAAILEEERDLAQLESNDLRLEVTALEQENQRLQQQNLYLQERDQDLQQELQELRAEVDNAVQAQPHELQSEGRGEGWITEEECDEKHIGLEAQIAELEMLLAETEGALQDALQDFANQVAQREELEQRYKDIEKQLKECEEHRKIIDQSEDTLRQGFIHREMQLEADKEDLQAQLRDAKAKLDGTGGISPSKKRKRGSADSQSTELLEAQLESLQSANDKLNAELERLRTELEECRKHRKEMEHDLLRAAGNDDDEEEDEPQDGPPADGDGDGDGGGGGGGDAGGGGGLGRGRGRKPASKPTAKKAKKAASKPAAKPAGKTSRKSATKPPPATSKHGMALRKRA